MPHGDTCSAETGKYQTSETPPNLVVHKLADRGKSTQHAFWGGVAGVTARTITAPFDRLKLLLQTMESPKSLSTAWRTATKQGFHGLWRGNLVVCARVFPYSSLQFGTFSLIKHRTSGPVGTVIASVSAALVATTLTYPLDVIRVRLAVHPEVGISSLLSQPWRSHWRGYQMTCVAQIPFTGTTFFGYSTFKEQIASAPPFLQGGLATLVANCLWYPLDTLRRRRQVLPDKHQSSAALWSTKGLYHGFLLNTVKVVLFNGTRFELHELFCHAHDRVAAR
eukprot:TRINITY_DN67530_c5_g1_i2.p1 TRINITY_DN67530_c5_g1~~TRINITY_DN67530_c5_g1_i2.p1  ORF type:complete len:279 (+),score=19.32 TRINITY_DN67530_c5_g1_i2:48-884(+)